MKKRFISAILLAAGRGLRMGSDKLLLPWGNHTLLFNGIMGAVFSKVSEIIVVSRVEHYEEVKAICGAFPLKLQDKIKIVMNKDPEKGMSLSLVQGLKACDKKSEGALFLLADQPFFGTEEINRLCEYFLKEPSFILGAAYKGQRKNPVIFPLPFFREELLELEEDKGGREIVGKYKNILRVLNYDNEQIFIDIDNVEDYEKWKGFVFSWSEFLKGYGLVSVIGAGGKTGLLWRISESYAEKALPCLLTNTTKMWNVAPKGVCIRFGATYDEALKEGAKAAKGERILLGNKVSEEGKLIGINTSWVNKLHGAFPEMLTLVEADGAKGKFFKVHTSKEPCIPSKSQLIIGVIGMSIIGKPIVNKYFHRPELVDYALCTVPLLFHLLTSSQGYFSKINVDTPFVLFLNHIESKSAYTQAMQLVKLLKKHRDYSHYHHLLGCVIGSNKNNYYHYISMITKEEENYADD